VVRRRWWELRQGQLPVTRVHGVYLPSPFISMALLSGLCLPLYERMFVYKLVL
jgi:hypothetical protein